MPAARAGAGVAAADGGRIVVYGGVDSEGQVSASLFVLETLTSQWRTIEPPEQQPQQHQLLGSGPLVWPSARAFAVMVRVAGHAYLHGGCGANHTVMGNVWRLSFSNNNDAQTSLGDSAATVVWSHILSSSQGPVRCAHAAAALGGSLAVAGGITLIQTTDGAAGAVSSSDELWVLEALTGEWSPAPPTPARVYGHAMAPFACDDCRSTLPAVLAVTFGRGGDDTQTELSAHWEPLLFVPGAALESPPSVLQELAPLLVIVLAAGVFGGLWLLMRYRGQHAGGGVASGTQVQYSALSRSDSALHSLLEDA